MSETSETDMNGAAGRVNEIIGDFDKGLITRRDAVRVRDRATKAIGDMKGYGGFGKRYGEEGYGEENV